VIISPPLFLALHVVVVAVVVVYRSVVD